MRVGWGTAGGAPLYATVPLLVASSPDQLEATIAAALLSLASKGLDELT